MVLIARCRRSMKLNGLYSWAHRSRKYFALAQVSATSPQLTLGAPNSQRMFGYVQLETFEPMIVDFAEQDVNLVVK